MAKAMKLLYSDPREMEKAVEEYEIMKNKSPQLKKFFVMWDKRCIEIEI